MQDVHEVVSCPMTGPTLGFQNAFLGNSAGTDQLIDSGRSEEFGLHDVTGLLDRVGSIHGFDAAIEFHSLVPRVIAV